MDKQDRIYIAALVDTLVNLNERHTTATSVLPLVQLSTKDRPLVEYLAAVTRVKPIIGRRDYTKGGCSEHCAEKHIHVTSVNYRWFVIGAKAAILLAGVRPYLRLRAERVDELITLGLAAEWRPQTVRDMRELGWPIPRKPTAPGTSPGRS